MTEAAKMPNIDNTNEATAKPLGTLTFLFFESFFADLINAKATIEAIKAKMQIISKILRIARNAVN